MGQEWCFFICLFVFLPGTKSARGETGSFPVLWLFCEFLVLVMVTHSAWRNLFLIPPTAPFCSKTPSLIFFSRALLFYRHVSSFLPSCKHGVSPKLLLWAFSSPKTGKMRRCALGGAENIVARMSTPTHLHWQWTRRHSFTPPPTPQKNTVKYYTLLCTHARTHTQLLPVLPLKPPSEAPPWF